MTVTRKWKEPARSRGALEDRCRWRRGLGGSTAIRPCSSCEQSAFRAGRDHGHGRGAQSGRWGACSHPLGLHGACTAHASDLDYHVIGGRPEIGHPAEEIDFLCASAQTLMAKLRTGDDLMHWSVWYGCILFDEGVVQCAATHVARHDGWGRTRRKMRQARSALNVTERIVDSGDREAALEQVRGVLSLTARWLPLAHDVFPLSRDGLSAQVWISCFDLAAGLHRSIHREPQLDELATGVPLVKYLTHRRRTGSAGTIAVPARYSGLIPSFELGTQRSSASESWTSDDVRLRAQLRHDDAAVERSRQLKTT